MRHGRVPYKLVYATTCLVLLCTLSFAQRKQQRLAREAREAREALELAMSELQRGAESEAVRYFHLALDLDSTLGEAHLALGDLSRKKRDYTRAQHHYLRVLHHSPELERHTWFGLGEAYLNQGNYQDARRAFEKHEELFANQPERKKLSSKYLRDCEFSIRELNRYHSSPIDSMFSPVNLGAQVNTDHDEYFPKVTGDLKTLIFTRKFNSQENFFQADTDSTSGAWGPARLLHGDINSRQYNEGAHCISPDGRYLYFTGCNRPDGFGSCDIYVSRKQGDVWGPPRNLGSRINTMGWEAQPALSPDGKTLYFVSNRKGGVGGYDIWKAQMKADGTWSDPVNLGPNINTPYEESSPYVHADNRTLYFASNGWPGMGNKDIFKSTMDERGEWQEPENLGYPINDHTEQSAFTVTLMGDRGFFTSATAGGFGGLDLYEVLLPEDSRPAPYTYLAGRVIDAENSQPLPAVRITVSDVDEPARQFEVHSDRHNGSFFIPIAMGQIYAFHINHPGYLLYSNHHQLGNENLSEEMPSEQAFVVALEPVKVGRVGVLNNVFFETGDHRLLPESITELQQLIAFMNSNPSIRIEIGGHTDSRGSAALNLALSERRANEVHSYLTKAGISASRLAWKGYGPSQPIGDNATAAGQQRNRRTEFKIIP